MIIESDTTNQPDTKSNPNPDPNPSRTNKQHALVHIQLNRVICPIRIQINVVAPFVLLSIVIVTLPQYPQNYNRLFITDQ